MEVSKLVVFSMGMVAANKLLDSDVIEVTPLEQLPMLSGEITDNQTTHEAKGVDKDGSSYQVKGNTTNTIQATWIAVGQPNRKTAPDVRRGEQVMIYRYGDTDKYYWATYQQDMALRRLETVVWVFSGNPEDGDENSADNCYFLELSTHQGHVIFHTSQANGELTTYDVMIDTKNGKIIIQDGMDNIFMIDSQQHRLYMRNTDQSFLDMNQTHLTISTKDSVSIQTKDFNVNASSSSKIETQTNTITAAENTMNVDTNTINGTTTHNGNLTENGAFALQGDMTAQGGSSGGSGSIDLQGDVYLRGDLRADGDISGRSVHSDTQSI